MRIVAAIAAVLVLALQGAAAQAPAPAPSKFAGVELVVGLTQGFRPSFSKEYHRFSYKGQQLAEGGKKPTALDATGLFSLPVAPTLGGGVPGVTADIYEGTGKLTGDLFDAINLHELAVPKVDLGRYFYGASRVAGAFDGSSFNAAAGVEAFPLHLTQLGLNKKLDTANWLVPGVLVSQAWERGQDAETSGIATYRMFVGRAFGWSRSAADPTPFDIDEFVKKHPDFASFEKFYREIQGRPLNAAKSVEEDFVVNQFGRVSADPAHFETLLRGAFQRGIQNYHLQPTHAFWLESKGWYTFSGPSQGPRWKPLVALVVTVWGDFGAKARSQFQIRYENGFDRADPKTRQNRLLVTLGLNF
jgi:hypothetical protein